MVFNTLTFFEVIAKKQTYANMLYLFLSFPLGIFYFVFLVTGIALGLGLFITWFGIPILIGVMVAWHGFAALERILAGSILGVDIPYNPTNLKKEKSYWKKLKIHVNEPYTWKSLAYLFLRFPLGILAFVVLVVLIVVTLSLIATPILYYLADLDVLAGAFCTPNGICFISNYFIAFLWGLIGLFLVFVILHIFNGLAYSYGSLAKVLLEKRTIRKK